MAHAVQISRDEMVYFLAQRGFSQISLEGVNEEVWGEREGPLSVRVFTTIEGEASRVKGSDSIRVALVWRDPYTKTVVPVGRSKRVHRVAGWKANLDQRLNEWKSLLGQPCPKCGCPTVIRRVGKGENRGRRFWGCASWARSKCSHFAWVKGREGAVSTESTTSMMEN